MDSQDNNKRIAKNTLLLYIRMFILLGVSLYTSRVVLQQLGVEDYGIYNVVGGVVAMLGFLKGSMSIGTQRFLAIAIAHQDTQEINITFQTALVIHFFIAGVVLIAAETIGLWFVINYLNIPSNSFTAAMWVYQCSIAVAIVGIINVPYTSISIANEHMGIYAYLSLFEAFLKLGVAILLMWIHFQKLILYSLLVLLSGIIIMGIWMVYVYIKYPVVRHKPTMDREISKKLLGFISWQTLASFAYLIRTQGANILLNIFFGPALNAARGIAVQVNAAVLQFITNFQMAAIPQINKHYAVNDTEAMHGLIKTSSKFSFMLMFILALPIMMETKPILGLWLTVVPEYGVLFVQLIIAASLCELLSGTLAYGALATGKIKSYQLVVSAILIADFPIVYLLYKLSAPPQTMFYVEMGLSMICFFIRLGFLKRLTGLRIRQFLRDTTLPEIRVVAIAVLFAIGVKFLIPQTLSGIIAVIAISFFIALGTVVLWGLSMRERRWAIQLIHSKLHL